MKDQQKRDGVPEWKKALVKWAGLFPALLAIAYTTKWIGIKPLALKLFVETIIVVPLVHYIIGPGMQHWFAGWLNKNVKEEEKETYEAPPKTAG